MYKIYNIHWSKVNIRQLSVYERMYIQINACLSILVWYTTQISTASFIFLNDGEIYEMFSEQSVVWSGAGNK
jgi:hypothetical protein